MDKERRVEMVRLEKEEVYDVEEVFGRDTTSVFPKQAKVAADTGEGGGLSTDMVREMLGGRKFVTESELETIRATRGGDDAGSSEPLKPLVEVLREAKEKKEQAFADQWKMMKTGKNRPLDADEMEFLDSLAEEESRKYKEQIRHEQEELAEFRRALAESAAAAEAEASTAGTGGTAAAAPAARRPSLPDVKKAVAVKPLIKAVLKPKRKDADAQPAGQPQSLDNNNSHPNQEGADTGGTEAKRVKVAHGAEADVSGQGEAQASEGLAGLLGDYGSGSDSG